MTRLTGVAIAVGLFTTIWLRPVHAQSAEERAVVDVAITKAKRNLKATDALQVASDSARESLIQCVSRNPSSCRIVGASALVQAYRPTIAGDSAEITVSSWELTDNPRRPIHRVTVRYMLKRDKGQWVVIRSDIQSTT